MSSKSGSREPVEAGVAAMPGVDASEVECLGCVVLCLCLLFDLWETCGEEVEDAFEAFECPCLPMR